MNRTRHTLWLPLLLTLAALAWRVAKLQFGVTDVAPGFAPWMALAFAGSIIMPRQLPWWLWPALLLGCDVAISTGRIGEMWLVYACYGAAALAGGWLRERANTLTTLLGTAVSVIAFYVVTNTQAWLMNPAYAQTLSGWVQAQTVGDLIHQPQSWVFLVRSLAAELGFAVMLIAASRSECAARGLPQLATA